MNSSAASPLHPTSQKFRHSISSMQSSAYRNSMDFYTAPQSLNYSRSSKDIRQRISFSTKNGQKMCEMMELLQQRKEGWALHKLRNCLTQIQRKLQKAHQTLKTKPSASELQPISQQPANLQERNDKTCEKNDETSTTASFQPTQQSITNYPKANKKLQNRYYLSHLHSLINTHNPRATDHLNLSLNVFTNLQGIKPPSFAEMQATKVHLAQRAEDRGKPTLVLDIDQTLIHCEQNPVLQFDTILPIQTANGSIAQAFIAIRPYAITFLQTMAQYYEIITFTASHQSYADVVLDELDPNHEYIQHRLYRRHCTEVYQNLLVKDLRIIDRDLSKMVLVDNAPYSYLFQPQNGVPILPFYEGQDSELYRLEKYLLQLLSSRDMREQNKQIFQFHRYREFSEPSEILRLYFPEG